MILREKIKTGPLQAPFTEVHILKKALKITGIILLALIVLLAGYLVYLFTSYHRIDDNQVIEPSGSALIASGVPAGKELQVTAWNIGFAAYTDQFSFFMDGGKYSRAFSREAVLENMDDITAELTGFDSDFYLIQEVDTDSTRAHHVDESVILTSRLADKDLRSYTFAQNYDSPYLFYPFTKPHGKSKSGLMTFSDYSIESALRRRLPVQTDAAKIMDLDRCYVVNRIPTDNGKELVLINFHLSAYTTDPTIANQQLEVLYEDMSAEYAEGNYVICGGDFNKDLLGDSSVYFGISKKDYSWAKSFPFESVPEGFSIVAPLDERNPVPSSRNADSPWDPETNFQITLDGFLVSDNVQIVSSRVVDTQFRYSDHNPVQLDFRLE